MTTSPPEASTTSISPEEIASAASCSPTTAGMSRLRAMMQTWLVALPSFVTKPRTRVKSIIVMSDGVSVSATTISPSCTPSNGLRTPPVRLAAIRANMSRTSASRARRYSSSIAANIAAVSSPAARTAAMADSPPSICASTLSRSMSSCTISRWAAKISSVSASAAICTILSDKAFSNFSRSCPTEPAGSAESCTVSRTTTKARPMAIPSDARTEVEMRFINP